MLTDGRRDRCKAKIIETPKVTRVRQHPHLEHLEVIELRKHAKTRIYGCVDPSGAADDKAKLLNRLSKVVLVVAIENRLAPTANQIGNSYSATNNNKLAEAAGPDQQARGLAGGSAEEHE